MEITFYRKLANKVADAVIEDKPYTETEIKKIRYGLVCIFSDMYKFIIYLIVFSVFSLAGEFLTAFLGLMLLRPYLGGFHSKSELLCIFLSLCIFLASIALGNLNIVPWYIQVVFMFLFPITGFSISPVKVNKIEKGDIRSKLLTGILTLAVLLLDFYLIPGQILLWSVIVTYFFALFQLLKNFYIYNK